MNTEHRASISCLLGAAALGLALAAGARASAQDDCCTDHLACQDGEWCTGIEYCNCWGVCLSGTPPDCNDLDDCTDDRCVNDTVFSPGTGYGTGHCEHVNICEPCLDSGDCDDSDECTLDECVDERCVHSAITCDDSEICTTDTCDPATGCVYTWIPECCHVDADCDDGLWCNGAETCNTSTNRCEDGTSPCITGIPCIDETTCDEATDTCGILDGWCFIDGTCVSHGTRNPSNECEACRAWRDQYAWSARNRGVACTADAIACTDDFCDGAGSCIHPMWPSWCYISGACWPENTRNPSAECEACLSLTDAYAWSPAPLGWACTGDTIDCTADQCDGAGACDHSVLPGWCLFGTTCVPDGTNNPSNECEWCDDATPLVWTAKPVTEACTDDGHTCTDDHCDGAGNCEHEFTSYDANDQCNGSAMTMSGSDLGRYWYGTGDTYCARDHYSSSCGGAGGTDTVHYFDIPVEYDTYRYRAMVGGPAAFDSVEYFYAGTAATPPCGQSAAQTLCNNDAMPACWTPAGALGNDTNDSCWYSSIAHTGMSFPNGRNYVVVDTASGTGGTYEVKVDRIEEHDISDCNFPLPEIQMGGTWTGTTADATRLWATTMPFCVQTTSWYDWLTGTWHRFYRYYSNIYHINHQQPPWDTLNRGYIVSVDGTLTPGGFDNTLFFAVGRCDSPWYLLSCDNNTYHYTAGPAGLGSKVVTGKIPPGHWSGIVVTSFPDYGAGNYTLNVELDDDGDGVPNGSDSSSLMLGSRQLVGGSDGAKRIPSWPWGDHGYSYDYPRNDRGIDGREVYYYYDNSLSGRNMRVNAIPRVRGDVWYGESSQLWDIRIWYQVPADQTVWCNGVGLLRNAATWYQCNLWAAGGIENLRFSGNTGRYLVAVDSWTSIPRGGWYTLVFY